MRRGEPSTHRFHDTRIEAVGRWWIRWIPELGDEDLDPHLLMWDVHRNVDLDVVPVGRSVLRFTFRDIPDPARDW